MYENRFPNPLQKKNPLFSHLSQRSYCSANSSEYTFLQHGMTQAIRSFDSIKISCSPKPPILCLYKASGSPEGIRDELPMMGLGNGNVKGEEEAYHTLAFWLFLLGLICYAFPHEPEFTFQNHYLT